MSAENHKKYENKLDQNSQMQNQFNSNLIKFTVILTFTGEIAIVFILRMRKLRLETYRNFLDDSY